MQIELNKEELDILTKALDAYQDQPLQSAMLQTVLMAALFGKGDPDDKEKRAVMDDAKRESTLRRDSFIGLQAKLIQAAAYKPANVNQ